MNGLRKVLMLACALGVAACSGNQLDPKEMESRPVEQLYNEAAAAMDKQEYREAVVLFEEVERQHPYSQWATQAQLMAGFAYYKDTCFFMILKILYKYSFDML